MNTRKVYSPERIKVNQDTIHSQNLIQMLAWAAETKVPFPKALRTLTFWDLPSWLEIILFLFKPILWLPKILLETFGHKRLMIAGVKPFFRPAVKSTIASLEDGCSLSNSLEMNLKYWLPGFYIESVKLAEEKGCLTETLMSLAETTRKIRRRKRELWEVLYYPGAVAFFSCVIIWFLVTFILPKYNKIIDDIGEGAVLPWLSQNLLKLGRAFGSGDQLFLFFLIQIPWILYICLLTSRLDWLLVKIPFIRSALLRRQMIESIQGLSIYTRMNLPLPEAIELVSDFLPASRLKNSFLALRNDTLNGISFQKSWLNNFPKENLINFYISSGLKMDKFSESLDHITVLLQEEDNRKHGSLMKKIEPVSIILISFLIAFVAFAMFMPMIDLIEICAGWEN